MIKDIIKDITSAIKDILSSRSRIKDMEKQLLVLKATAMSLKDKNNRLIKERQRIAVVGFNATDPEPTDTKERREYITQVQVFYKNVLEGKLLYSIAEIRDILGRLDYDTARFGLTREQHDFFLRGMEAQCWALKEWCDRLSGERLEDNQQENGSI